MIDRNHPRYLAVYGASVARQAFDQMERGLGAPDDADVARFVEEAHSVAEMAEEQQLDAHVAAEQAQRDRALGALVRAWTCPTCRRGFALNEFNAITWCAMCGSNLKALIAEHIAKETSA